MTEKEQLIKELENYEPYAAHFPHLTVDGKLILDVLRFLREQPEQKFFVDFDGKITPLPKQKHGNWIPIKTPTGVKYGGVEEYTVQEVMCSECGFTDDVSASIYTYCPECGAKMGGEAKQDG